MTFPHPRLIADARKARKASEQAQAKVKADKTPEPQTTCDHCEKLRSGYFGAWPFPCPEHDLSNNHRREK